MKLLNNKYLQIALLILLGVIIGIAIPKSSTTESSTSVTEEHDHQGLWSCSMHPQIVSETEGSCPICGMDLTPMEDNDSGIDPNALVLTEAAAKAAQLSTYTIVSSKDNLQNIEVSGTLIPNEDQQFNEISYVSGRIDYLSQASSGVVIQKGELIAKLYSPELISAQQELISLSKARDQEPNLFNAVVQKFKNWNFDNNTIEAIIESESVKQSFPIYANETGTITDVKVKEGDWIKAGQTLYNTTDLSVLWAEFEVYETQINHFKKGQELSLNIQALSNQKRTARVDFVDPLMDTQKRIGRVRVSLDNTDQRLKPGMFVQAQAGITKATEELLIPASAVLWTGKESFVYVKSPTAPTYTLRTVSLKEKKGQWYSIEAGLETGEQIVERGTFVVDAAAQLAGKSSMINQ